MDGVTLVQTLNQWAGEHGVGRTDMVEDRLIGIKSREIYEAPGRVDAAQRARGARAADARRSSSCARRACLRQEYADLIYNGLWFTAHHQDLAAYVHSTQRYVTGAVRMRLHKGQAVAIGKQVADAASTATSSRRTTAATSTTRAAPSASSRSGGCRSRSRRGRSCSRRASSRSSSARPSETGHATDDVIAIAAA